MGWDIVAIGTNHKLPLDNPQEIAKRLLPLCPGDISIGYYRDRVLDLQAKSISPGDYEWIEEQIIKSNKTGPVTFFEDKDKASRLIFQAVQDILSDITFDSTNEREDFLSLVTEGPFYLYGLENPQNFHPYVRVFKEIFDMDVNFPGRWSQFADLFRHPYAGIVKEHLDVFRTHIFTQMRLSGCDCAYYFPDQGYGGLIFDNIHMPVKEWLLYLCSKEVKDQIEHNDETHPYILSVRDYLSGKFMLGPHDDVYVVKDDFSDLLQNYY